MRRILVVLALLLSGALVASGMWVLSPPSITPFIVPGATGVQVVTVGWGQQQISYRTSGPPNAWYWTVVRTLEEQHWTLRNRWRPDESSINDPVVPLSFERGYAGVLWDEVVLAPDRRDLQRATIIVRRRISIPWWRSWLPMGEGRNQKNAARTASAGARHPLISFLRVTLWILYRCSRGSLVRRAVIPNPQLPTPNPRATSASA